jgi:beta-aspartyl-peptidase (threonine type)
MTTDHARTRWAEVRAKRAATGGGTVGAVARDAAGTVAAATSTGGRIDKAVGRVGDSPVLGAGTYADNETGACSATGEGEAILRVCLARRATDLLGGGTPPEEAARGAVATMGARVGGSGGLILVDRLGRMGLARNTRTMTWAAATDAGDLQAGA